MQNLKLNSLMRNLSLIAAGALLATLVVLPITTWADDEDDEDSSPRAAPARTYILKARNGANSVFTLVENDGSMVLTLVEKKRRIFKESDDD